MLSFGISIGESRDISLEKLHKMELLLSNFVDDFPYHERYIVQNIHSIKHFSTTTKDFGPLFNFSTFNFEGVIGSIIAFILLILFTLCTGYLSASIHGTKQIGTELVLNLQLFKQAYYASKHHCLSSTLWPFIQYLDTGNKHHHKQQKLSNELISQDDLNLIYELIPNDNTVKPMKSSKS